MTPQPTPAHRDFVRSTVPEQDAQAPLGAQPSYDAVLDLAVEYTFPASDPVAVGSTCQAIADRDAQPGAPSRP